MKTELTALMIVAASFACAQAGHRSGPPDEMKSLEFLVGDWSGKQNFNSPGSPLIGDITYKVHAIGGGRFLEEVLSTTLPDQKPTEVHHYLSYDPETKKYRAWWFNDTSNKPSEWEGTLDGNKLIFMNHPANPKAPVMRATYEKVSGKAINYKLEMKSGDAWQELFHNNYGK